jgi:hypothetical protein
MFQEYDAVQAENNLITLRVILVSMSQTLKNDSTQGLLIMIIKVCNFMHLQKYSN